MAARIVHERMRGQALAAIANGLNAGYTTTHGQGLVTGGPRTGSLLAVETSIFPLRTVVGRALPVVSANLLGHSDLLDASQIRIALRTSRQEAEADTVYRDLHPAAWFDASGAAPLFGAEVRTYRVPADLPVDVPAQFAGLFVLGPEVADLRDSRRLWAEFSLELADPEDKAVVPLLGGLIIGGYPYTPSYLSPQGEPSANHMYPREARVTWRAGDDAGFLDDETSRTWQLPAWQSSHHVFAVGPVRTRRIVLRVSDLARSIRTLRAWDPVTRRYREHWTMALPLVYGFEYEEGTVQDVNLGAGMVCATQTNRSRGSSPFSAALDSAPGPDDWDGAESTWVLRHGAQVYPFTPQSALLHPKNRRRYPLGANNALVDEVFVSNELAEGDRLLWLLAQRDENPRCVAGLRLQLMNAARRVELGLAPGLPARLQVYEVDPLPGTAVARVTPGLTPDRFSRLLAHVTAAADGAVTVRFTRAVASRYLHLVFTATGETQIAVDSLMFVRSAAASVTMRPSRSRRVHAVHFRLVGEHLGEDLARLGRNGFSLAVDRVCAGEPRERLFAAHSIEELVRAGAAQLMVNSRTRAVEVQQTVVVPGSFEETRSVARSSGWQRHESGREVDAPSAWTGSARMSPDGEYGFETMGNEENRVQVRHVAHVPSEYRSMIESRFPTLHAETGNNEDLLWKDSATEQPWAPWRTADSALARMALKKSLDVSGLWNVSVPPYWHALMEAVDDKGSMDEIVDALKSFTDQLFLINGAGIGTSAGFGLVIPNWSWSNNIASAGVATALRAHSIGTTGSVTRHARRSGYSYSQNLVNSATETDGRTDYMSSHHTQTLTRSAPKDDSTRGERLTGTEVMWNRRITDVLIGTIPIGIELPAHQEVGYRTTDESVRVSFTGLTPELMVDAWFEAYEELVRDDDR
jgi:hypothetical protein